MIFLNLFIFVLLFHNENAQVISSISFTSIGSVFKTNRDGFLLATLNTGETTTICNYKFTEADANVACLTLGFPAQGMSIVNPNSPINSSVLIGDIACTGTETNFYSCINSGRKVYPTPCSAHKMDVYLYCLQDRVSPVITPVVSNTLCNASNGDYSFTTLHNKINSGYIKYQSSYFCDDDYSVNINASNYLCQKFCSGISNPLPILFAGEVPSNPTFFKLIIPGYEMKSPYSCNPPIYALALQCGSEPTVIESPPNVTCDTHVITATWDSGFIPQINPSLISIPMPCEKQQINLTNSTTSDAIVAINFTLCSPIVTSTVSSISYSYILTREYVTTGITSITPRNMTISCTFPRVNSGNQNVSFQSPNIPPLGALAFIQTNMLFYTDTSFQTLMPTPYTILDNQLMYVMVSLDTTLSIFRLGLVNCKVSTVNSMADTNQDNSVVLISNSCPAKNVAIYPLNTKQIGFQFQPAKINNNNQLYVLCETTKCFMGSNDSNCLYCNPNSSRRKRSVLITDESLLGPIIFK